MKKLFFTILVASLFFAVSCGSNSSNKPDEEPANDEDQVTDEEPTDSDAVENDEEPATPDTEPDEEPTPVEPLDCADLTDGMNKNLMVGDYPRDFILHLPEDAKSEEKLPVVFAWHGYGDTAENFDSFLSGLVDNETMPFILVVPEADTTRFGLQTMQGLDWDMLNITDGSAEADMFDEVLACIGKKWAVDEEHIHLSGFSAGAITANSVAQLRSEKVASIFTFSGAYFSDPESVAALDDPMGFVAPMIQWPEMEAGHNTYTQVLVSGAEGVDTWGMASFFNIDFNVMASKAAKYLYDFGHDVILCNHGGQHTVAGPALPTMIQFFSDHPFGAPLAYEELPAGYDVCKIYGSGDEPDPEDPDSDNDDPTDDDTTTDEEPVADDADEPETDDAGEPDADA